MSSNGKYSAEQKAAVLASLLAGQSITQVAKEYDIPVGTIWSWKSRQKNGETLATLASEKREEVGELILTYLRANLTALVAHADHTRNVKWLHKQDASSLGVLHGIMTDKAVRLLEAMNNATED